MLLLYLFIMQEIARICTQFVPFGKNVPPCPGAAVFLFLENPVCLNFENREGWIT